MIAQGDFQKVLFANTEERGKIFRQIFGTDIYRVLQDKLKDAVKNSGKNMMNCGAASISIWRELSVRVTLWMKKGQGSQKK